VIAAGVLAVIFGWLVDPVPQSGYATLIYLAVGTQIAALRPIPWRSGSHQWVVDPLLIAAGLYAPGAGVALIAWLAVFDGRLPGRSIPWWAFLFNRAMLATAYGIPSMAVASFGTGADWSLPARTILYVICALGLNYLITALSVSLVQRAPILTTLFENVGVTALVGTAALSFSSTRPMLAPRRLPRRALGYALAPSPSASLRLCLCVPLRPLHQVRCVISFRS